MGTLGSIMRTFLKKLLRKGVADSYSQDGEDLLADALLSRKSDGVYVDVGAYHPIQYSNTYHFYKKGWKGIVIDPNSTMRPLYKVFRSRDTFVHAGVAQIAEERPYYLFTDGAYNTFSESDAEAIKKSAYPTFISTRMVACKPLADILKEQGITAIDFLTVDVEGLDAEVLASHDWNIRPRVIAVEDNSFSVANAQKSEAYTFLTSKGYELRALAPHTLLFIDLKPS